MKLIDTQVCHVWMVRAFLKHCDESADDEELAEVHRGLYDFALALGPALEAGDSKQYIKMVQKKLRRLRSANDLFTEIQPEVSGHLNFKMAAASLRAATRQICDLMSSASLAHTNRDDE